MNTKKEGTATTLVDKTSTPIDIAGTDMGTSSVAANAQSDTQPAFQIQQQQKLVAPIQQLKRSAKSTTTALQMGEIVGRGACGKVYKAFNFQTGQLVAIKQVKLNHIKQEQKGSIQSEINLLKKLDHPNIVKYIDSIYTEHHLNIVLEYVENGSLENLIKKFGKFQETLVAVYIQQVLHGLDYLHSQGVIHRDIKGGNILTTKDGIVKLADFGVATKLTDTEKNNSFAGTPYWMAPEIIEMSQVKSACDIWSLGCTVIELLTGKPPYFDFNCYAAMNQMVSDLMPPLPDHISEELRDFLIKCFEKDPMNRIDAKQLLEHQWLKKYDKHLFQRIIQISNNMPEEVTNTIRLHIDQVDKGSTYQSSAKKKSNKVKNNTKAATGAGGAGSLLKDEEEDGEIGDFGEEINDLNDVPIERPKCLSHINNNLADKSGRHSMYTSEQNNYVTQSQQSSQSKKKKLQQAYKQKEQAQSFSGHVQMPSLDQKSGHQGGKMQLHSVVPELRSSQQEGGTSQLNREEYNVTEKQYVSANTNINQQQLLQNDDYSSGSSSFQSAIRKPQIITQQQVLQGKTSNTSSKQSLSMAAFNPNVYTGTTQNNSSSSSQFLKQKQSPDKQNLSNGVRGGACPTSISRHVSIDVFNQDPDSKIQVPGMNQNQMTPQHQLQQNQQQELSQRFQTEEGGTLISHQQQSSSSRQRRKEQAKSKQQQLAYQSDSHYNFELELKKQQQIILQYQEQIQAQQQVIDQQQIYQQQLQQQRQDVQEIPLTIQNDGRQKPEASPMISVAPFQKSKSNQQNPTAFNQSQQYQIYQQPTHQHHYTASASGSGVMPGSNQQSNQNQSPLLNFQLQTTGGNPVASDGTPSNQSIVLTNMSGGSASNQHSYGHQNLQRNISHQHNYTALAAQQKQYRENSQFDLDKAANNSVNRKASPLGKSVMALGKAGGEPLKNFQQKDLQHRKADPYNSNGRNEGFNSGGNLSNLVGGASHPSNVNAFDKEGDVYEEQHNPMESISNINKRQLKERGAVAMGAGGGGGNSGIVGHHQIGPNYMFGNSADFNQQRSTTNDLIIMDQQQHAYNNFHHQRYSSSLSQLSPHNDQEQQIHLQNQLFGHSQFYQQQQQQQQTSQQMHLQNHLSSIEDHIKQTQLSTNKLRLQNHPQKAGMSYHNNQQNQHQQLKQNSFGSSISSNQPMHQDYKQGGISQPQYQQKRDNSRHQQHVQHKSIFSNFQYSTESPRNMELSKEILSLKQIQQQPHHLQQDDGYLGLESSFENYFDSTSNNNNNNNANNLMTTHFDTLNEANSSTNSNHAVNIQQQQQQQQHQSSSHINMQELINVRESYSKKMLDNQGELFSSVEDNSRKVIGSGMLMMLGAPPSYPQYRNMIVGDESGKQFNQPSQMSGQQSPHGHHHLTNDGLFRNQSLSGQFVTQNPHTTEHYQHQKGSLSSNTRIGAQKQSQLIFTNNSVTNKQQQQQQLQSLESGRSKYSLNQQRQYDLLMAQQIQDEGHQYALHIKQLVENPSKLKTYHKGGAASNPLLLSKKNSKQQLQCITDNDDDDDDDYNEEDVLEQEQLRYKKKQGAKLFKQDSANNRSLEDNEQNSNSHSENSSNSCSELSLYIRKLTQLLKDNSSSDQFKDQLVQTLCYYTLIKLLGNSNEDISYPTLQLVNQLCENSAKHQEIMCLSGFIPYLILFGSVNSPREMQIEVAYFIGQVYQCSRESLQMFISNQGLSVLINFLSLNYNENKDLVMLAVDSFLVIFDEQTNLQIPAEELSVILARQGLLETLAPVLPQLITNAETSTVLIEQSAAEKYLEKVFDVLQQLASGPIEVKERICATSGSGGHIIQDILIGVVQNTIQDPSPLTLMIVKRYIKILQLVIVCPSTINDLENQGVIKSLIDILQFFLVDIQHIQLQLVYDTLKLLNNLCKLSPSRTEQAALNNLLAPLKELVIFIISMNDSISRSKRGKLLKVILSILHEFVVASNVTRQLLNGYQIQQLLLSVISMKQQEQSDANGAASNVSGSSASKDHSINAKILDLYVLWLQTDSQMIEPFLSKKLFLEVLFNIFILSPRSKVLLYVFSSLNRMVQLSASVAKSLISHSALIGKLSSQLLQCDYTLNQTDEQLVLQQEHKSGNGAHHHSKNSSSARSCSNIVLATSSGNVVPRSCKEDASALDQISQQQNASKHRSSQQTCILKELMEIFWSISQRSEGVQVLENYNLLKILSKVASTAEQNDLVILQQIAQNVLTTYYVQKQKMIQSNPAMLAQPNEATLISKSSQPLPGQARENSSQQVNKIKSSANSIRSKSPIYQ